MDNSNSNSHLLRLLQGLAILNLSARTKQEIEEFLNAQLSKGQVNQLEAELQALPQERQAQIIQTSQVVHTFNKAHLSKARQSVLDISESLFESAANEAELDE
jgi:hypothetical protein